MANFDWIGTFINWFPMLLLIAVWIYFMRRMGLGGRKGYMTQFQRDYMEQMQRQNESLTRIAAALESHGK